MIVIVPRVRKRERRFRGDMSEIGIADMQYVHLEPRGHAYACVHRLAATVVLKRMEFINSKHTWHSSWPRVVLGVTSSSGVSS